MIHTHHLPQSERQESPRFAIRIAKALFKLAGVSLACACLTPQAYAYRPFDGTDAGVAETGTFELEIGASRLHQAGERTLGIPAFTANFGLQGDSEIVIDGRVERRPDNIDGPRTSLTDTAISLKHVWKAGSLQDKDGISLATECGLLLPTWHGESGVGATCAGIASQKWSAGAVHLNLALTRARDHDNVRFASVIVEGPEDWPVRPVMEISNEHASSGARAHAVLAGFIWKWRENLVFDAAFRKTHDNGETGHEIRAGATWSMPF